MKKTFFIILCILFLAGCQTNATKEIVSSTQKAVEQVKASISTLDKGTTPECRTDAFIARLDSIKSQVDGIAANVKNIGQVCEVEKEVRWWDGFKTGVIGMAIGFVMLILIYLFVSNRKV